MHDTDLLDEIANLIINSHHLVIFTGAGVSTESGLADYRGPDGVWTRRDKGLKPKTGPSVELVKPNRAHLAIKKLQDLGFLKYLISQNVDNLHLRSGINPEIVSELHGNHALMKCSSCDLRYSKEEVNWDDNIYGRGYRTQTPVTDQPDCPSCQGRLISSIVNFDDPMPIKEMEKATNHSKKSDVYTVVGSTLLVQPAAFLPKLAFVNGAKLVIINIGETPLDSYAQYRITEKAGEFLDQLIANVKKKLNKIK
ncbi:MAG: NAD-dependent protein deacylase 2 [Candidatus Heimdallarchaeota archaeon LC_3]|nr:MAG: NAD-dependent protein deacylase 2 [Candidatus Heimdallarchaeota archaeon LC_3]